jgi:hypothetical protein
MTSVRLSLQKRPSPEERPEIQRTPAPGSFYARRLRWLPAVTEPRFSLACGALLVALSGCDREQKPWEQIPPAVSSASRISGGGGAGLAPRQGELVRREDLELLALSFTSAVRDKAPADRLVEAKPGDRVYAHLTVRNLSGRPRKVGLLFVVNGHQRTEIDLEVGPSWSWRTWGFNTLLADDDPGELVLRVTSDDGKVLANERLPIR